ncbi:hypothetical protein [Microvirga pudoricolor]|uniref:hypothetical protein n=1 Tax=Microvirga pudoricolor TaxID=2778729 RepID=UPI00194E2218|nr:hypothetical protein [Microvirga pudoricolor]MBM6592575.1 hypothetical protein [Microvirga pudoricolor]
MAQEVMSAAKADRLSKPVRAEDRSTVTTVELVGIGKATVILRDEAGKIVYRADPQSNTTFFAKDVDLPVVTIKEEAASPVAQRPVNIKTEPKVERENALEEPKRKSNPVGCLGALSPLVKSEASKTPSLCLASLETGRLS